MDLGVLIGWVINAIRAVLRFVGRPAAALVRRWELEGRYRWAVAARHKFLDPPGLAERPRGPIRLKDIYVEPRLVIYQQQTPGAQDEAEGALGRRGFREGLTPEEAVEKGETVTVSDALGRHDRIIILGDPGLGKTTLLSYLALLTAQGQDLGAIPPLRGRLPIYLRLRDVSAPEGGTGDQDSALIEPLAQACSLRTTGSAAPFVKRGLDAGRCLILLDGLDEVADQAQRVKVSDWIANLVSVYPKNPYIVASRSPGHRSSPLGAGFREAQIVGFSPEQVNEFVRNWYRAVEAGPEEERDRQADDLLSRIRDDDRLSDLASNPLLLCLMVSVHIRTGALPARRAELYEQFTTLLLEDWERQKGAEPKLSAPDCRDVLAGLALELHNRRVQAASRSDVEGILSAKLEALGVSLDAKPGYLAYLRERVPLLEDQGGSRWGFAHPSFQEYLAALALERCNPAVEFLVARRFDAWWREVTLLFAGLRDASDLVEGLVAARDDIFKQGLLLAGTCIADAASVKPEPRADVTATIEGLFWEDGLESVCGCALEVLAALNDPGVLARTVARADSDSSDAGSRAVDALERIGGERAAEHLIPLLKHHESGVRANAVYAVQEIAGERAMPHLIPLLEDDDSDVRASAAYALGEIGREGAIPTLIPLLKDEDFDARTNAAAALGKIGGEKVLEPLLLLVKDDDSHVREGATHALGKIGGEKAVDLLIPLLKDDDWYVRRGAAYALAEIGGERAAELLIPLLKDEDSRVGASAAYAVGKIGGEKGVDFLIQLLGDEVSEVRGRAAHALGKVGGEKAVERLIQLLKDEDSDVRWSAAYALGEIGGERAVEFLIPLLKDEDSHVRATAAYALGEIGAEKAAQTLIQLLKDKDSDVRASAAGALAQIVGEKAVPHLIALLNDESPFVRATAAYALGEIGGESALGDLIPLLDDDHWLLAGEAASAIEQICARERLVIYDDGQMERISDLGSRPAD